VTATSLRILPLAGAAPDSFGGAARLRGRFAGYVEARSRAVAIRVLERLSDATLADLGIARGGIREFVRNRELPWS